MSFVSSSGLQAGTVASQVWPLHSETDETLGHDTPHRQARRRSAAEAREEQEESRACQNLSGQEGSKEGGGNTASQSFTAAGLHIFDLLMALYELHGCMKSAVKS